ncbi:MAG: RluA family pseudouridine synthase [Deltaproteobacteria bacterium]|nr:RluA family pseudouridine synthase [Deltaproteobacteria bacterium]
MERNTAETFVVDSTDAGQRLDRVVGRHFALARARAVELCERGLVRINGRRAAKGEVVSVGDEVAVTAIDVVATDFAPKPNPAVDIRVLYVDDAMIAVDKAAGIATFPLRSEEVGTLANGLVAQFPELAAISPRREAGIAHRLDRGTSGVVVVGRTAAAYAALRARFARHEVDKEYVALVLGRIAEAVSVTGALRKRGRAHVVRVEEDGLHAETRYSPIEAFGATMTLIRVETRTGRRHQVRAHLASVGHPLAGDATFQSEHKQAVDPTGLARPFLHASRVVVLHPVTGARIDLCASLPDDLEAVLQGLRALR